MTGATGFIGGALARRLASDGWEVACLVRPTSRVESLKSLGVDLLVGDVLDPSRWSASIRGVDCLFHLAAQVELIAPDRKQLLRTNVEGTRRVLQAAQDAGIPRVVYLSSVAAIGKTKSVADESMQHDGNYSGPYEESKHLAERAAFEFGQRGLDVVHVLPSVVVGHGDPKTGRLIKAYLRRRIPALLDQDGLASYVAIEDLVDGILLAHRKGRGNERYIFTQANWTTTQLMSELERASGVPPPSRHVSLRKALWAAGLIELLSRATFRRPPVTRQALRLAVRRFSYSSAKARQELGWDPQDFQERFGAAVRRYQAEMEARAHKA